MSSTTLFACEPQPIVLEGLKAVLRTAPEIEFVGSAATPADALARIAALTPKVVLLDQLGGLKAVFRLLTDIRTAAPAAFPILWVPELAEIECFRALQLGARGILKKTLPVDLIPACVHSVARGTIWMEHVVAPPAAGLCNRRQGPRLTPRERDILRCLCRGMRNKEIGNDLAITPGTVKVHLMHIFEKTGVKDRFELAVQGRTLLGLEPEESKNDADAVCAPMDGGA